MFNLLDVQDEIAHEIQLLLALAVSPCDVLSSAIYTEVSEARTLIEQLVLLSAGRQGGDGSWSSSSQNLLENVENYLVQESCHGPPAVGEVPQTAVGECL
eukprot:s1043_g1.t1